MIKVQDIAFEKPLELLLMKDQKVIQACLSHTPQKTLTDSIGLRGSIVEIGALEDEFEQNEPS